MNFNIERVLNDPVAHDSLKTALRAFVGCDPIDAVNDAEFLAALLRNQLDEIHDDF